MENAADALKLAAFVLIFVLTLSITIASFSQAREVAQILIDNQDKTYNYTYINYQDSDGNLTTERIVGAESIVPTIYRSFLENYKVYFFDEKGEALELYEKEINGKKETINFVDLERDDIIAFANDNQKEEFIMALLYGANDNIKSKYLQNYKITLKDDGIYGTILLGSKFKEELGEYYQEDLQIYDEDKKEFVDQETNSETGTASNTPEANKVKKRIITYTKIGS